MKTISGLQSKFLFVFARSERNVCHHFRSMLVGRHALSMAEAMLPTKMVRAMLNKDRYKMIRAMLAKHG